MKMRYTKMSGAGNTFIVVDGADLPADADLAALATVVCSDTLEHGGADGFIAIAPWGSGDFEMKFYNRDGSSGMMCGNGGRCAVRFASEHGYAADSRDIRFVSAAAPYRAELTERGVRLYFPDPKLFRLRLKIDLLGAERLCHFADVGTPHVVVFVDELGEPEIREARDIDIERWGPALRHHPEFAPDGANANFVEVRSDREGIILRTFERGVEGETGACGTGAVASAIIAARLRDLPVPVSVTTTSGATLHVDFAVIGEHVVDVALEGEAEIVMEGELDV